MKQLSSVWTTAFLSILFLVTGALAAPKVGEMAPDFSGKTSRGETITLSGYKGKTIVLEWTNYGCPFIRKHYNSNNMQEMQKHYTEKGVIWLSILSSGEGREGYMTADQAEAANQKNNAAPTAFILDAEGTIGKLYGAKTTPQMFVIHPDGKLVYTGALDDDDSTDPEKTKTAKNYVRGAVDAVLKGQAVPEPTTTDSYGCSVKYKR